MSRGASSFAVLLVVLPFAASPAACAPSSAPTARDCVIDAPDTTDWRLRADGVLLRDAHDRIVALRGVNAGARSKIPPYHPFDYAPGAYDAALAQYMDRAVAWGIDVLRVPFAWQAVEPAQGADDTAFLAELDAFVDAAWARRIWTVLDFHQDVYAENFCGDGFPAWTIPDPKPAPHHDCPNWVFAYDDAPVKTAFDRVWASGSPIAAQLTAMWERMAVRYKDRAGVLGFEPMNEPGAGSAEPAAFEGTTLSDFYAAIAPRIRAAAPGALVFLGPTGFAAMIVDTPLKRPPVDGVVFAPHYYPLSANAIAADMQRWAAIGAAWNAPTFVGEFGAPRDRAGAREFIAAHFAAFDALGIGGAEWEYSASKETWNDETYSVVDGDGVEHDVALAMVRPYARAVAGSDLAASYDADSRIYTLAYMPADGVSEIALPARAYPDGYDVSLRGACVDRTKAGMLLVKADDGATKVELRIAPK